MGENSTIIVCRRGDIAISLLGLRFLRDCFVSGKTRKALSTLWQRQRYKSPANRLRWTFGFRTFDPSVTLSHPVFGLCSTTLDQLSKPKALSDLYVIQSKMSEWKDLPVSLTAPETVVEWKFLSLDYVWTCILSIFELVTCVWLHTLGTNCVASCVFGFF